MSLRSWKRKLKEAKDSVTGAVGSAVDTVSEKASGLMDTTITLETAQEELIDDLEKGLPQIPEKASVPLLKIHPAAGSDQNLAIPGKSSRHQR